MRRTRIRNLQNPKLLEKEKNGVETDCSIHKKFSSSFESVQHVRNGPIREGRGHREGNFYVVSVVVVVVVVFTSLSLSVVLFSLRGVPILSLSLAFGKREDASLSLSLHFIYEFPTPVFSSSSNRSRAETTINRRSKTSRKR